MNTLEESMPDARDQMGRTSLFYAVRDGDITTVISLLEAGAETDITDSNMEAPLHFAARYYRTEIAKLLLDRGSTVDLQDVHGNTPLWRAVYSSKGRGQMIELLRSFGANKSLKNNHGVSPEGLANTIANYDIAPFLSSEI